MSAITSRIRQTSSRCDFRCTKGKAPKSGALDFGGAGTRINVLTALSSLSGDVPVPTTGTAPRPCAGYRSGVMPSRMAFRHTRPTDAETASGAVAPPAHGGRASGIGRIRHLLVTVFFSDATIEKDRCNHLTGSESVPCTPNHISVDVHFGTGRPLNGFGTFKTVAPRWTVSGLLDSRRTVLLPHLAPSTPPDRFYAIAFHNGNAIPVAIATP